MSGGSATIHGQKATTGNEGTEKILLIVNVRWVGGWKTKFWEVIVKRGKGPSPKGKGSHKEEAQRDKHRPLWQNIWRAENLQAKLWGVFFVCLGLGFDKIRNFHLTRLLRETGKDAGIQGPTHLWTKQEKLQAQVKPPQVQASAIKQISMIMLLSKLHPLCKQLGHICEHPDVTLLHQTWKMIIQHSQLQSAPQYLHAGMGIPAPAPYDIHSNSFTEEIPSSHKLLGIEGGLVWLLLRTC